MELYKAPTGIEGPVYAIAIDSYLDPTSTIQYGTNGKPQPLSGRDVEFAPPEGWDQVILTGDVQVKAYRVPPSRKGGGVPGPRAVDQKRGKEVYDQTVA